MKFIAEAPAAPEKKDEHEVLRDYFNKTIRGVTWTWEQYLVKGYELLEKNPDDVRPALDCFRKAYDLEPKNAAVLTAFGTVAEKLGRWEDAQNLFKGATDVDPDNAIAASNYANSLRQIGEASVAYHWWKQALKRKHIIGQVVCNHLLHSLCVPGMSDEKISEIHKKLAVGFRPPNYAEDWSIRPAGEKELTVGYVSPDFRAHSVMSFVEPVIKKHRIPCFVYDTAETKDHKTLELQKFFGPRYRDLSKQTDDQAVETIKKDGVDILVDLAVYTAGSRVGIAARRAAPIQISWIGYAGTSGMPQVDYRFTDDITDPIGAPWHGTEKLVRLPAPFLCWSIPTDTPPISDAHLAAWDERRRAGAIRFGSANAGWKLNRPVIDAWAVVLKRIPRSELWLKNLAYLDPLIAKKYLDIFHAAGVERERVNLQGTRKSRYSHLEWYHEIDVALDTWPYGGTTTTCEALWMKKPVVAMRGDRHATRVTPMLLEVLGRKEWIATGVEDYVNVCEKMAREIQSEDLGADLRADMVRSPLMDADRMVEIVEAVYRHICIK